ncbi:MAG: efflux RND transporter periplasmic adaptor subunit [Planctomycetes bacterium]|nr:efflux RND transporter periplasmic adaptor subunit [Planctomycetota bacterium]
MLAGTVILLLYLPTIRESLIGKSFDPSIYVTNEVRQGPFQISVTERGTVGSSRNSVLTNRVEGTTTIISIVPEGTIVKAPVTSTLEGRVTKISELSKNITSVWVTADPLIVMSSYCFVFFDWPPIEHTVMLGEFTRVLVEVGDSVKAKDYLAGDVVCELDSSVFEDKHREQRITITKSDGELKKARTNVQTQMNQNESDIAAAVLAKKLAELDLEKFRKGDSIQDQFVADAQITLAEQKLAQAREAYEYTRENVKLGFENLTKQESDRIAKVDAQLQLDIAEGKKNVLTKYEYWRTLAELEAMDVESIRAFERAKLNAKQGLEFFLAVFDAAKATHDFQMMKIERLQKQLDACILVAPQDGTVVYSKQRSRGREPIVIEEGVQIYQRQKIIDLPDYTQMKVDAKIHESKISQVHAGQSVHIRINAFPERVFQGVLEVVPDVPVRGEWPNYDQMFYEVEIRITGDVTELKTGMNAEVEIISDERDNVLQIPIQALVKVGDEFISYVLTSTGPEIRRDVNRGAYNNNTVEIISGLKEGEAVIMNPRSLFDDELSKLQSQYEASEQKKQVPSATGKRPVNKQQKAKQPASSDGTRGKPASGKKQKKKR